MTRWPARHHAVAAAAWCVALTVGVTAALRAQGPTEPGRALPPGDVFRPLLADPKQPQFFAAYLRTRAASRSGWVSNVGLGESIGLWRGAGGTWQLSLAAGVLSQFDMDTPSNDLINTDFIGGLALTVRRRAWSGRLRFYHQSSHLGDEWVLNHQPQRVNLSFEALEVLVARDAGSLRLYAGGEYLVRHDPAGLKPGVLHAGVEYRPATAGLHVGPLGHGRLIAALDTKAPQERGWTPGFAARAGLEFGARRTWSVQLHGYHGPTPYGQFYVQDVTAAGVGMHFRL